MGIQPYRALVAERHRIGKRHIDREAALECIGDIPYALEGRFAIDVPFANPVTFRNEGSIRLNARELAADRSD